MNAFIRAIDTHHLTSLCNIISQEYDALIESDTNDYVFEFKENVLLDIAEKLDLKQHTFLIYNLPSISLVKWLEVIFPTLRPRFLQKIIKAITQSILYRIESIEREIKEQIISSLRTENVHCLIQISHLLSKFNLFKMDGIYRDFLLQLSAYVDVDDIARPLLLNYSWDPQYTSFLLAMLIYEKKWSWIKIICERHDTSVFDCLRAYYDTTYMDDIFHFQKYIKLYRPMLDKKNTDDLLTTAVTILISHLPKHYVTMHSIELVQFSHNMYWTPEQHVYLLDILLDGWLSLYPPYILDKNGINWVMMDGWQVMVKYLIHQGAKPSVLTLYDILMDENNSDRLAALLNTSFDPLYPEYNLSIIIEKKNILLASFLVSRPSYIDRLRKNIGRLDTTPKNDIYNLFYYYAYQDRLSSLYLSHEDEHHYLLDFILSKKGYIMKSTLTTVFIKCPIDLLALFFKYIDMKYYMNLLDYNRQHIDEVRLKCIERMYMEHGYYSIDTVPEHLKSEYTTWLSTQVSCPICLEMMYKRFDTVTLSTCKHAFHVTCIDTWKNISHTELYQKTCPLCRTPI